MLKLCKSHLIQYVVDISWKDELEEVLLRLTQIQNAYVCRLNLYQNRNEQQSVVMCVCIPVCIFGHCKSLVVYVCTYVWLFIGKNDLQGPLQVFL